MSTTPTTKLYRNTGTGLVDSGRTFAAHDGSTAWADTDNDGRLDVTLSGVGVIGGSRVHRTLIYRDNGNGTFAHGTQRGRAHPDLHASTATRPGASRTSPAPSRPSTGAPSRGGTTTTTDVSTSSSPASSTTARRRR